MQNLRTILVVDDNPVTGPLCAKLLEREGYTVILAVNGAEAVAVQQARYKEIDAVLMDIMMPVMDGVQAVREIRREEVAAQRSPVPIIMLTSQDTDEDRESCREAGCTDYLCRPVRGSTLSKTIQRHLPVG